jgi:uncharacterized protein (TIGR01777 family)
MKKTILITGGTGLVGSRLSQLLTEKDYKVIHLSRKRSLSATYPAFQWNIEKGEIDEAALLQADYIITLAGAGIADKRWTKSRKKLIIDSRVNGIQLLKKELLAKNIRPKAIIGASAIGFYGDAGQAEVDENSRSGNDFLSESVRAWEGAYQNLKELNIRIPIIRVGIVLSTLGGALSKMLPTYKVGVGTYFGNGQQIYSWIHIDDICKMFIHAIENEQMEGTYNGVAPNPVSNKTMAIDIGKAMDKLTLPLPAPAFGLKFALGEMAAVVLSSSNVTSQKVTDTGFQFDYPKLVPALKDILDNKK